MLIYSDSIADYLTNLELILQNIIEKGVRFNIEKCDLVRTDVELWDAFCPPVWLFSPKFFNKILSVSEPEYRHELAQLDYLANWLMISIPHLAKLRDAFSLEVDLKGKTLIALKRRNEPIQWTPELRQAFHDFLSVI